METLRAVKGMNDLLPEQIWRWQEVEATYFAHAARYGFGEIRPPLVEPTALFVRSIGDTTDIVEKEMYTFTDKGDHSLTLRPEGTASAVRAYIQHTVHARQPVTKWTYSGPMFRRERPAKGRYRQFYQLGAEVLGDAGPYVDAELIEMLVRFIETVGVSDVEVLLNSLGSEATRAAFRSALLAYVEPRRGALCSDCQRRIDHNPLRVLDCKVPSDAEIAAKAPSILDHLEVADRDHFEGLKDTLSTLGITCRVEPALVRGLDYYTRTLFEVKGRGGLLGAQDTICGGGRYDNLVAALGGPPTPAIGFAIGVERLLMMMPEASAPPAIDVFVVAVDPDLRPEALAVAAELRSAGLRADLDLRGQSVKSQMRRGDKSGARLAVLLGRDERAKGVVQVRDLAEKQQEEVARHGLVARARELLGRSSEGRPA